MTWVKFHGEIRQGAKRGLSRATRFIYLELSHETRPTRGVLRLPSGMNDVDAVHDVLGGNRKEVAAALKDLQHPAHQMVTITDHPPDGRALVVVNWSRWNSVDSSANRVRKHRGNADVTRYSGVTSEGGPVTALQSVPDSPLSLISSSGSGSQETESHVDPPRRHPGALLDDVALSLPEEWRAAAEMAGRMDADAMWPTFQAHHRSRGTVSHHWPSEWTKWVGRQRGFDPRDNAGRRPVQTDPPGTPIAPWLKKARDS